MQSTNDSREIMTLGEVAEYLQLAEKTVLRMAQRGEIPAAKVASQWRFLRSVVRDWLAGQMYTGTPSAAESAVRAGRRLLPLSRMIRPELLTLDLAPGPKEDVLRQLLEPLRRSGFAKDPTRLLDSLLNRERMMTTAIGQGVALPHPRRVIPGMFREPGIALGICREGTDFEAVDDQLVHLLFLICATRDELHLQLLAQVSLLTKDQKVVAELSRATTTEQATALISEYTLQSQ
jgi:PTS system nitrogen regulatory IIA component